MTSAIWISEEDVAASVTLPAAIEALRASPQEEAGRGSQQGAWSADSSTYACRAGAITCGKRPKGREDVTNGDVDMSNGDAYFVDQVGVEAPPLVDLWDPVVIPSEAVAGAVHRLSSVSKPANGRRRALIVHPRHEGKGLALAPGIQVALEVLLPGEETKPVRHNSSQVVFSIRGGGSVVIDGRKRPFGLHDVWNTPSMATYHHINDTDDLQVRLVYSNAAMLEKLNIHYVDEEPGEALPEALEADDDASTNPFAETMELPGAGNGETLMSYERLINPPVQQSPALMWQWKAVKPELDRLHALGSKYRGRRLYLLYNPSTGRTNGTTHNFFATMCLRPAGIVDRPHRHTAAAINYYMSGSGHSVVAGKRYPWKAGDLMLSAPGWAVHNHASHEEDVYELTIQDSPFNLANDSLLWQEDLKRPPILIGSHPGWDTNRRDVAR